ncbi:S41 family peptidase [Paenibacillus sp. GCM10023252]|uniref:S41 family peptidase n=1 Tax=Paenibacillus sp. GCM10023252 TaxID=3252649 RepID=UPI00361BC831
MRIWASEAAKRRMVSIGMIAAIVIAALGFLGGKWWMEQRYPMLKEPVWQQFNASYHEIMNDYLEGAKPQDLINGAAVGMVESLEDPYSNYLVGEQGEAYTQGYEGRIFGVGAEVRLEDGQYMITSLTKGAPAERGGLMPEDVILEVDGTPLKDKTFQDLIGMLRGEEGTKVKLKLARAGQEEPYEVTLKREEIPIHTVTHEMLEDGIGHITISRFGEQTAEEFDEAIAALRKQGLKGLLLDMRSNPGGLLKPTIAIADKLIPKDKVILQVVYKNERQVITYKSKQREKWELPITVLVNGQSASASEVLTAALKESAGAKVIGETTYGKGIVQAFNQFKDGSVLSLTEAEWKTPGGTWIHKKGVVPDIKVTLPAYASLRPLPSGTPLKQGSFGEDVKTLQTMLGVLGYPSGPQEGLFDDTTTAALKRFQRDEGLTANGVLNDKTSYVLLSQLREQLKKDDSQLKRGEEELKSLIKG